jgi:chemotaxis signal transduction protein
MPTSIVPFLVGEAWLALDALRVWEVTGPLPFVPIPGAASRAPGVVLWQGRAVALVDVAAMVLGTSAHAPGASSRLLITQAGSCTIALPADRVREAQPAVNGRAQSALARGLPCTLGEVELEGRPIPVVDLDALVAALIEESA